MTQPRHKQETPYEFIVYCENCLSFLEKNIQKTKRQISAAKKSRGAIKIITTVHLLNKLCEGIDTELKRRIERFNKSIGQLRKIALRIESGIKTAYNKTGWVRDDGKLEAMDKEDKENTRRAREND